MKIHPDGKLASDEVEGATSVAAVADVVDDAVTAGETFRERLVLNPSRVVSLVVQFYNKPIPASVIGVMKRSMKVRASVQYLTLDPFTLPSTGVPNSSETETYSEELDFATISAPDLARILSLYASGGLLVSVFQGFTLLQLAAFILSSEYDLMVFEILPLVLADAHSTESARDSLPNSASSGSFVKACVLSNEMSRLRLLFSYLTRLLHCPGSRLWMEQGLQREMR